ncbi:MAG: hypothetical protein LBL96_12580 [Clostridiales bacterium]|nr:hypothetical protein [Clostridiales bacterium]
MNISQLTGSNYFASYGYSNAPNRSIYAAAQTPSQTHDYLVNPNPRYMNDTAPHYSKYVGYAQGIGIAQDEFTVSRLVGMISDYMGKALSISELRERFDLDGDGSLSRNELTTMIKGLVSAEHEKSAYIDNASMSIIEQIVELSKQNEKPAHKAAGRYERLFQYEQISEPQELALFMA